jgi:tetratricopeptide (TPR) repeat protein
MTQGLPRKTIFKIKNRNGSFQAWVFLLAIFSIAIAEKTVLAGPLDIDKQYQQAKTLVELEAIAGNMLKTLNTEPHQPELEWRLARSYYSMAKKVGDDSTKSLHYDQCIDRSSRALELKPNSAISYFYRALCRGKQGEMKGIWASLGIIGPFEEDMKKALELDPVIENGGPHRALGKLYLELPFFLGGNVDQSVYHLGEAVRLGPDYAENHLGLAQAYYAKNNLTFARKSLLTLMTLTDNIVGDEDLLNIRKKGQELMNQLASD